MARTEDEVRKTTRAARELAHAASYLASEAASLARVFEAGEVHEASAAASRAAVRAAESAFRLDELALRRRPEQGADLQETLRHAQGSLDAAAESIAVAKECVTRAYAS